MTPEYAYREHKERWPATVSVALRLGYIPQHVVRFPDLVLVTKRETGKLGLIAGGIEADENLFDALYREAREEAGLSRYDFRISDAGYRVIFAPHNESTSVGLIYDAIMTKAMGEAGYDPGGPEVSLVKPYPIEELIRLYKDSDVWYRPEFNRELVRLWLEEYIQWKYGVWEGEKFAKEVARRWGIIKD